MIKRGINDIFKSQTLCSKWIYHSREIKRPIPWKLKHNPTHYIVNGMSSKNIKEILTHYKNSYYRNITFLQYYYITKLELTNNPRVVVILYYKNNCNKKLFYPLKHEITSFLNNFCTFTSFLHHWLTYILPFYFYKKQRGLSMRHKKLFPKYVQVRFHPSMFS